MKNNHKSEISLRYRWRRFLWSKGFYFTTRILLPLLFLGYLMYAAYSSEMVRRNFESAKSSVGSVINQLPFLAIKKLELQNDTDLHDFEIEQLMNINLPSSRFSLDFEAMKDRLVRDPAIGDAMINLSAGGTLSIHLTNPKPVIVFYEQGVFYALDKDGVRIKELSRRAEYADFALISGEGAENAVAEALMLADLSAPIRDRIKGFDRRSGVRWDAVLTNNLRLRLPAEKPEQALGLILKQHAQFDIFNRDLLLVDYRDTTRPVIRVRQNPNILVEAE